MSHVACPKCSFVNSDASRICSNCGTRLRKDRPIKAAAFFGALACLLFCGIPAGVLAACSAAMTTPSQTNDRTTQLLYALPVVLLILTIAAFIVWIGTPRIERIKQCPACGEWTPAATVSCTHCGAAQP